MSLITVSLALVCVLFVIVKIFNSLKSTGRNNQNRLPGPKPWPLIGNLVDIGKYESPADAFASLAKTYGDAFFLKLGVHDSIVISGWNNFKDVLITRGHLFDSRPQFSRFDLLMHNDKNNSIAFSDGVDALYKSRSIIGPHSFLRNGSMMNELFDEAATKELFDCMDILQDQVKMNEKVNIKPLISNAVTKAFIQYFCSTEVDVHDPLFQNLVKSYDIIFQEINSPCAGDVLPILMPFFDKTACIEGSNNIREFTLQRLLAPRQALRNKARSEAAIDCNNNSAPASTEVPNDLLNSFMDEMEQQDGMGYEKALMSLEDMLGGSSACVDFTVRALKYIAKHPEVQRKIKEEANAVGSEGLVPESMRYTQAVLLETLRFVSSGIVPHVASQDTTIADCFVKKGTVIMFNNYALHFSPELWDQPEQFMPERFINNDGRISKPVYFVPFSTGKRSCLGQRILMNLSLKIVANLCQNFDIDTDPSENYNFPKGVLSVGSLTEAPKFVFHPIE